MARIASLNGDVKREDDEEGRGGDYHFGSEMQTQQRESESDQTQGRRRIVCSPILRCSALSLLSTSLDK
jgi:hypothetical protein